MAYNLDLFYHFYICPDERGLFWNWWLDEQAQLMAESKLFEHVPVQIHITMPKYWNMIYDIPITKNASKEEIILEEKVLEYIYKFYPHIKPLGMRDTSEVNIFEGTTLTAIWEHSQLNPHKAIGYIHNKGVMSVGPHSSRWRRLLNEYFITEWRDRYIELLEGHDVVCIKDKQCDDTICSGNFFYARTDYIRTLNRPDFGEDRYAYEKWILSGTPKVHVVTNTYKDHFLEY